MECELPSHQRSRQRTVNRILLRLIIAAGVLAVGWSTWSTRATVERALLTTVESDLTALITSVVDQVSAAEELIDFAALIPDDSLARIAIFQPEDDRELACIAATEAEWASRISLLVANHVFKEGDHQDRWLEQIEGANAKPIFYGTEERVGIAQRAEGGVVIYADLGTGPIQGAVAGAAWRALFSALIRAAVVGGLLYAILWIRVVRPIGKVAAGGEALAQRNADTRLPLRGPDEIAKICSALNALASDCELERHQVERETARWRALFDEIPAAAFIFANGGRILEANRRALEILQADIDSLRQCERSDLVNDDGSLRLGGGDLMPSHWVEAPIDHEGRPATFGAALDLREASSAKEQMTHLARVLDAVDVMVVEVGAQGAITACNAETARWMGQPIESIPGLQMTEAFDFQSGTPAWREIARDTGLQGSWKGEITAQDGNRNECTLLMLVAPLPPGGSGTGKHLAVLHDISEVHQLREALSKTGRLEQAGLVAGALAQELRSQMAGLLAYTTYLRDSGQGGAEVNEGLASIEASGSRVKKMADHLLALVRRDVLRSRPTDLNRLVQEVAAGPEAMAASHVSITVETDESLEAIPCDPDLVAKALREILRNGLEAIRAAGSISFRTRAPLAGDDEDSNALIEIHDTGEGLSPIAKPHSTEMFFTTREGHHGVGLAVAEGIVRLHGGELEIEGEPGKGTWVRVSLPAEEQEFEDEPEHVSEIQAVPTAPDPAAEKSDEIHELISRDENDDVIEELFENVEDEEGHPPESNYMAATDDDVVFMGDGDPQGVTEEEELEFEELQALEAEDGAEGIDDEDEDELEEEIEEEDEEESEEDAEEEEEEEEEEVEADLGSASENPVLLIVDDEEIVLDLVKDIFSDEDYEIITAIGGEAAVEAINERGESIFMALVDLTMPGMNGWEVATALHEVHPGISIHIASGYSTEEEDIPSEVQHIISGLVRKPFRAGKLRDLIDQELSRLA